MLLKNRSKLPDQSFEKTVWRRLPTYTGCVKHTQSVMSPCAFQPSAASPTAPEAKMTQRTIILVPIRVRREPHSVGTETIKRIEVIWAKQKGHLVILTLAIYSCLVGFQPLCCWNISVQYDSLLFDWVNLRGQSMGDFHNFCISGSHKKRFHQGSGNVLFCRFSTPLSSICWRLYPQ